MDFHKLGKFVDAQTKDVAMIQMFCFHEPCLLRWRLLSPETL